MGCIYVDVVFYNPVDYADFVLGECRLEDVKRISLKALVDTSATSLTLPEDFVEKLDLPTHGKVEVETATGEGKVNLLIEAITLYHFHVTFIPNFIRNFIPHFIPNGKVIAGKYCDFIL